MGGRVTRTGEEANTHTAAGRPEIQETVVLNGNINLLAPTFGNKQEPMSTIEACSGADVLFRVSLPLSSLDTPVCEQVLPGGLSRALILEARTTSRTFRSVIWTKARRNDVDIGYHIRRYCLRAVQQLVSSALFHKRVR